MKLLRKHPPYDWYWHQLTPEYAYLSGVIGAAYYGDTWTIDKGRYYPGWAMLQDILECLT